VARAAVLGRLTWRLAEVVATLDETPTVRTLSLRVPDWPGHLPGQHVDIRLTAPDGYTAQRGYSIATPANGERIDVTVERLEDGEVSPYLNGELVVGDQIELRGPIGGYFVWEPSRGGPVLLVAGGTGVVPLMAMVRERARRASTVPVRLLLSARTFADLVYRDELDRLAAADDGFSVTYALTRGAPAGWTGHRRRVDEAMLAEIAWPVEAGAQTFVCGSTPFVEAVTSGLVALGHPAASIRTERYGAAGAS